MSYHPQRHYSVDEYFEIEASSNVRHEYFRGEVFAMAGASRNHNRIVRNLLARLTTALAGGPCEPFASDMRLRTPAGLYTYPDLLVVCGPAELTSDRLETMTNPTLLVEVLSRSTERFDRGEKLLHYVAIPSLREYVLIEQSTFGVEQLRPSPDGLWEPLGTSDPDASIHLSSVDVEISLRELYARVEWPEGGESD